MKYCFALLFSLSISLSLFSQQKNTNGFKCLCEKIGLNNSWADSNKISCYLIPVSKNSLKPSDKKYLLAVVVAPALNKHDEEPLLYLHGGPGITTLGNVPRYLQSKTWKLIREKRSLIFFDYRGTGFSEPELCAGMEDSLNEFLKTKPTDEAKNYYTISLYKKCRKDMMLKGTDLSSFSSMQLAADADAIRHELQIATWHLYGVSFGTRVALNMLRYHSKNIKSVILDSPWPPNAPWADFVHPFASCFTVLEKNIAADLVLFSKFPELRNDFERAVKRLNKNPAKLKSANGLSESNYSGDDFAWSVWKAMLNPKSIPFLPLAIHEIANGNDSILPVWKTAFSSPNTFGKYSEAQDRAILCFEGRPTTEEESQQSLLLKYPEFSSFNTAFNERVCNAFRPDIAGKKIFAPVVSNKPVLILAGEYDPVCPPLFAEITAKTLSKSTLIIVPSASHAAINADDCIRNIANSFICNPAMNPQIDCVKDRLKIKFVTKDLMKALKDYKN
ncbi:MAG: alpha/beta fold hydrolase [Ferruginibacter sp.]